MAILIVDDDAALCETLVDQLAVDGEFTAIAVGTIGDAEEKLDARGARFDAVILDVRLPDGDGRDLCAKLRQQGQQIPIIMLTGSDAKTDVVRGPDSGANDYIAKPFRLNELLARLPAQVRAFEDSADAVFVIGPYTFRPSAKLLEAAARDQRIRLTEKEAGILKFLYRAGGTGRAAGAAQRGLGLQCCCRHAHAGDPHLSAAPEDRARPSERASTGDRGGGYQLVPEGVHRS
jgi:DNA-binding response OmpR family regulator